MPLRRRRLTAASFSLKSDQRTRIALLADRPLRRLVNNRIKDLGSRNCEEERVLPERCSIRINTFEVIQTFGSKGTNFFQFAESAESIP